MNHNHKMPYLTGFRQIDLQHKDILEIIDRLTQQLDNDYDQTQCLRTCSTLVSTLREHYDHEERFMLKCFYPDTEGHIGQHMTYLIHLGKLVTLVQNNHIALALKTLHFMSKWMLDHMNYADKKYADFIHHPSA